MGQFAPVTHNLQICDGYSVLAEGVRGRVCAPVAESEVVLGGAPVVAVTLDYDDQVGEFAEYGEEELGIAAEGFDSGRQGIGSVVGEEDVLEGGGEDVDSRSWGLELVGRRRRIADYDLGRTGLWFRGEGDGGRFIVFGKDGVRDGQGAVTSVAAPD